MSANAQAYGIVPVAIIWCREHRHVNEPCHGQRNEIDCGKEGAMLPATLMKSIAIVCTLLGGIPLGRTYDAAAGKAQLVRSGQVNEERGSS